MTDTSATTTNNEAQPIVPYQQWLTDCLTQQQGNIQQHQLPNQEKVWVRRADKHNSIWLYRLLGIFTSLLGTDALQPVPSIGGRIAITNEAAALKRLSQADIATPKLLAVTDDALMISHLEGSQTLSSALSHSAQISADKLLATWQTGVLAIVDVHQKQQHLSQCFARNMMLCADGGIAFIDFEDAPEKVLTLHQCQIRDWLCYLFSTAVMLDNDDTRQQAVTLWRHSLINGLKNTETVDKIIADIYRNTRFLAWMRHLHDRRWRSDTLRIAGLMRFIQQLHSTSQLTAQSTI